MSYTICDVCGDGNGIVGNTLYKCRCSYVIRKKGINLPDEKFAEGFRLMPGIIVDVDDRNAIRFLKKHKLYADHKSSLDFMAGV